MDIEIQSVLSQNITLVYDSLDLQVIDRSKLRELMGLQKRPMIMDTSEMIVAVYPPEPFVLQIGDRRIRVVLPQHTENIGSIPLWEIAVKCAHLVPESKSTLIAYGFNYDLRIALTDGKTPEVIMDLFISNRQVIETALQGRLVSYIPRVSFQRGQTLYDLIIEPLGERQIKVHMNAHFEFEDISLPTQDQLQASFFEEHAYLVSMLPRLLEGGS